MRTLKLTLEYDGTDFFGFQIQARGRTVQGEIEKALHTILKEGVRVIPAGRTDSGVHALGQVAHFKTRRTIPASSLLRALNANLPKDVAVLDCEEAGPDFHARKHAAWKTYRYTVLNRPVRSALLRRDALLVSQKLNLPAMRRAARLLVGEHDFRSFQATDKAPRSSRRRVRRLTLKREGPFIRFEIEGNGFLYNMVRNIVGTLLLVGRGKIAPSDVRRIRDGCDRRLAGPTAPAHGLCLIRVTYGAR